MQADCVNNCIMRGQTLQITVVIQAGYVNNCVVIQADYVNNCVVIQADYANSCVMMRTDFVCAVVSSSSCSCLAACV